MSRPADPHARSSLIASARREFLRQGIQRARIEDITAACGLSKGAFYLHFETKEALFRELVEDLRSSLETLLQDRLSDETAFFARRGKSRPDPLHSQVELDDMNRRHDRAMLEMMWERRDVLRVLISGTQGTPFEGVMWRIIDSEMQRVAENFERLRGWGACRSDVSGEVIASLIVGAWLLMARRMSQLKVKPDFEVWTDSWMRLLAEGTAPRSVTHKKHLKTEKKLERSTS